LGTEVEFETIHGPDKITVPPLTQSGAVIKLSNAGINKVGYHILTIEVELPNQIDASEKKLLGKIRDAKSKK
jgi:molecular chaperone DnaJ